MYNPKSTTATEFISDSEIRSTMEYARANSCNRSLIDGIMAKAAEACPGNDLHFGVHTVDRSFGAVPLLAGAAPDRPGGRLPYGGAEASGRPYGDPGDYRIIR